METKGSYITVGIFVFILAISTMLFAMWISRIDLSPDATLYKINFSGSVTGLRVNERVYYHGIPIGTVRKISVDPGSVETIHVLVNIERPDLIREDAVAVVEAQGLTGYTFIQIEGSSQDKPRLEAKPGERYPEIQSRDSSMEALLNAVPNIVEKVDMLANRFNALISDENQENFTRALDNFALITDRLAKGTNNLDVLVQETRTSLTSFKKAMDALHARTTNVGGEMRNALRRLSHSSKAFDRAAHEIEKVIQENRAAIKDFTSVGLPEFSRFLSDARDTMNEVTDVVKDFGKSPRNFFHKSSEEGYAVQNQ